MYTLGGQFISLFNSTKYGARDDDGTGRGGLAIGRVEYIVKITNKKDKCSFITIIIRKSMDMPSSKRELHHTLLLVSVGLWNCTGIRRKFMIRMDVMIVS